MVFPSNKSFDVYMVQEGEVGEVGEGGFYVQYIRDLSTQGSRLKLNHSS